MRSRRSLRALCGVLLLTMVAVPPVAAAPSADEGRGWFETVEAWWGQLVDRLGAGRTPKQPAAVSQGSEGDAVPTVNPLDGDPPAEENSDTGPSIDPAG